MLGLGLSLSLGSTRTGGGAGAPQLIQTPAASTAIGVVLTVSSGATLYRDSVAKTTPYTTTANDALAHFWAADASDTEASRSASIVIASTAAAPTLYAGFQIVATTLNNGGATTTDNTRIFDMESRDGAGLPMPGTDTTSTTVVAGSIAALENGNPYDEVRYATVAAVEITKRLFSDGSRTLEGATFKFAADTGKGPGDFKIYGIPHGSTTPEATPILTVTGPHDYSVFYAPTFTIPSTGFSVGATYSYDTGLATVTFTNEVGTTAVRAVDISDPDYPIEIADWVNKADGATIAATTQGAYSILARDSANPSGVVASAATLAVFRPAFANAIMGANPNYLAGYGAGDEAGNNFDRIVWYWGADASSFTTVATISDDGCVTGPAPSGQPVLNCTLYENRQNLGRSGLHEIIFAKGGGDLSLSVAVNITVGTITSTTAAYTINAGEFINLRVSVNNVTFDGSNKLKLVSCKSDDTTDYTTHSLSPQAMRDYEPTQMGPRGFYFRNLTSRWDPSGYWGAETGKMRWWAKAAEDMAGLIPWNVSRDQLSDAERRAELVIFRNNTSSNRRLALEYGNEPWNFGGAYGQARQRLYPKGIEDGFLYGYTDPTTNLALVSIASGKVFVACDAAGHTARIVRCDTNASVGTAVPLTGSNAYFTVLRSGVTVTQSLLYSSDYPVDYTTHLTSRAYTTGEVFLCHYDNGSGVQVILVECIANAAIGATVPFTGSNTYFRVVCDASVLETIAGTNLPQALFYAMFLEQAYRQSLYGAMGKEELPGRTISILGATTNQSAENATTIASILKFQNNYENIDRVAMGSYGPTAYDYNAQAWMATPTSVSTWVDNYFITANAALSGWLTAMRSAAINYRAACVAIGIPINKIPPLVGYEVGFDDMVNVPSGKQADTETALKAAFADPRMRTLAYDYAVGFLTHFEGVNWFQMTNNIKNDGTGTFRQWIATLDQHEIIPPLTRADAAAVSQAYLGALIDVGVDLNA